MGATHLLGNDVSLITLLLTIIVAVYSSLMPGNFFSPKSQNLKGKLFVGLAVLKV